MSSRNDRYLTSSNHPTGRSGHGYSNDYTFEPELPSNLIGLNPRYNSFHSNDLGYLYQPTRQATSSSASTLVQDDNNSMTAQTSGSGQQQQWSNVSHGRGSQQYGGQDNMTPQVDDCSRERYHIARDLATQQQSENVNTRLHGSGMGNQDQDNRERRQFQHAIYGAGDQFQTASYNSFGNTSSVNSSAATGRHALCNHGQARRACFNPYCPHYISSRA